jgi:hypothetical protein
MVYQEQNFYWQRFSAFATLHAALFVLVTATMIGSQFWSGVFVSILSIGLAITWIAVQSVSLKYVDRWKSDFHTERELAGILPTVETDRRYSSTDLGWWVPVGVLVLWLIVLGTVFFG